FGHEIPFIASLSIMKIPGIGKETGYKLLKMGGETVRVLSEIPVELLQNLLGKNGARLWRNANGIDESPVIPYHEQKSISTERTYQQDTIDVAFLHGELVRMTEKIAFELRRQNRLTGCVTVKIRYSDFETHDMQRSIPYTNADHVLLKTKKEIFNHLKQRSKLVRVMSMRKTKRNASSEKIL